VNFALIRDPETDRWLRFRRPVEVVSAQTIANIVARIDGKLVTPPVSCGLLAGTFRAELLERGEIEERVITVEELPDADVLYLIKSVQGWKDVEWVE
jgi:para-aminobenzoate synthetase/4-amino-4-deoxychorismate lyase